MISLNVEEINPPVKTKDKPFQKNENDCLICKLMKIRYEKVEIVKWIFSSDKSLPEKMQLATLFTGIIFDKEVLECLQDPSIKKFIFSE